MTRINTCDKRLCWLQIIMLWPVTCTCCHIFSLFASGIALQSAYISGAVNPSRATVPRKLMSFDASSPTGCPELSVVTYIRLPSLFHSLRQRVGPRVRDCPFLLVEVMSIRNIIIKRLHYCTLRRLVEYKIGSILQLTYLWCRVKVLPL